MQATSTTLPAGLAGVDAVVAAEGVGLEVATWSLPQSFRNVIGPSRLAAGGVVEHDRKDEPSSPQ